MTFSVMQPDETEKCIDIAVNAFMDYEYFSIYYKHSWSRRQFLKSMLTTEFRINADREMFLTAKDGEQIVAVVILCDPSYQKPTDQEYLKGGFWKSLLYGGYKNVDAWNTMENCAIQPCTELKNSWYLSMLVVDTSIEGKGIGSGMLQECIIPYVKKSNGETLCLFTNSQINRKFYQKNGFVEFDQREFAYHGKTIGSWSYVSQLFQ